MVEAEAADTGSADDKPQLGVGGELRRLRTAAKLDLNDIGSRTRIPIRHLEAIERDDFAALPSATYAIGFTKAYARALGADERPFIERLRTTLNRPAPDLLMREPYVPVDRGTVPSRLFAWTALALGVLVVGGYLVSRAGYFDRLGDPTGDGVTVQAMEDVAEPVPPVPDDAASDAPSAAPATDPATASAPGVATASAGPVLLTATAPVWIRVTDGTSRLFEGELRNGQNYQVPPDARAPRLHTGRAEALQVSVGGTVLPQIGPAAQTLKDIDLTPQSLQRRQAASNPPSAPSLSDIRTGDGAAQSAGGVQAGSPARLSTGPAQ